MNIREIVWFLYFTINIIYITILYILVSLLITTKDECVYDDVAGVAVGVMMTGVTLRVKFDHLDDDGHAWCVTDYVIRCGAVTRCNM